MQTVETVADRLTIFAKKFGGLNKLAEKLGKKRGYFNNYVNPRKETGKTSDLGSGILAELKVLGLDVDWLLTGEYANDAEKQTTGNIEPGKPLKIDSEDLDNIQIGQLLQIIGKAMEKQELTLQKHDKKLSEHDERINFIEKHLRIDRTIEVKNRTKKMVPFLKPDSPQKEENEDVGKREHSR